ncbi:MAG: hypothetical protein HQK63_17695 [Desulfamplus sp.]|nr:hypothetical protein [Desulfamplus sp.]
MVYPVLSFYLGYPDSECGDKLTEAGEVRLVCVFCLDWLVGVGYSGGINNLLKES